MWGVLGQSGRCAGSSADWPFSAGMANEAPLSRRLASYQRRSVARPSDRQAGLERFKSSFWPMGIGA